MKNLSNFLILLFCLWFHQITTAQISFSDKSVLLSDENHYSGVAMGIIDMNGDGLDDIVRQNRGTELNIEIQTQNNQKFIGIDGVKTGFKTQWAMCIADVDNNGTNEILTGGTNGEIVIVQMLNGGNIFTKKVLDGSFDVFVQGSNFVDIDNDGFVDVFVCNDVGESRIWLNNGTGDFIPNNDLIDMSVIGDSGEAASGNYGSTWLDVDNDGDIDLYIAKCRQGVTDVNDKRRINQLYINDGNGNFTEEARDRGLAVKWQSWSAEFQDINNDGWLDCFITNHDHNSQMFLNDGTGNFVELEQTGIAINGLPIQGLMRDFDNDGWIDVVSTGSQGQIFRNNGDLTFSEISDLFDENDMESLAVGDLNGDGYLDIYGGYAGIFNQPSSIKDKLWMNDGGDNNYLVVSLVGVESNKNAIGARVEIYGDWGIQIREVRSGESYGINNSNISYFGLGQADKIDSLMIRWPSGLVQKEYEFKINSKIKIIEGVCLGIGPTLLFSGPTEFCTGDSLTLSTEEIFNAYLWSNNTESQTLTVSASGNYSLQIIDSEGCSGFSENVSVSVDPILQPKIIVMGSSEICQGASVVLEETNLTIDESLISWSNGDSGYTTTVENSGFYSLNATGLCDDFESNAIEVIVNDYPNAPEAKGDSIKLGEVAKLSAIGGKIAWFDMEFSLFPIGYGSTIEIEGLTTNSSFYAEARSGSGITGKVGMEEHKGSLYSDNPSTSSSIKFNALKAFTLDSVKVYTDLSGLREIIVTNKFSDVIASALVDIQEGESTIYLGFEIPEGQDYALSTDFFQNFETTGDFGPRLQRSSLDVNYPYTLENVVELTGSDFGQQYYYYFYDWSINSGVFCASDRTEVSVVVDESVNTIESESKNIIVFPNPSNGNFTIQFLNDISKEAEYSIVDLSGKPLYKDKLPNNHEVVLHFDLDPGMYIIQVLDGLQAYRNKIIIK